MPGNGSDCVDILVQSSRSLFAFWAAEPQSNPEVHEEQITLTHPGPSRPGPLQLPTCFPLHRSAPALCGALLRTVAPGQKGEGETNRLYQRERENQSTSTDRGRWGRTHPLLWSLHPVTTGAAARRLVAPPLTSSSHWPHLPTSTPTGAPSPSLAVSLLAAQ